MSVHSVRCPCRGKLACELCRGQKFYDYEVTDRGWMPFACPTCKGERTTANPDGGEPERCVTCHGDGWIDPGNPPMAEGTTGVVRKIWKIFFGG